MSLCMSVACGFDFVALWALEGLRLRAEAFGVALAVALSRNAARSGRAVFGRWPRAASSDWRRFRQLRASAPVPGPGGAEPVAPPRVCRWCCWAQEQQSPLLLASRAAEPAARPSPWVAGPGQRAGQNGLGARALGLCRPEADQQARGSFSCDRFSRSMPRRSATSVGHKVLGVVACSAAVAFGIGNRRPHGLPRRAFCCCLFYYFAAQPVKNTKLLPVGDCKRKAGMYAKRPLRLCSFSAQPNKV